jgi:ankyrin repeat protein
MSTKEDLHDACANGQLHKVREILQKDPDIINRLDQCIGLLGDTPLHKAASQGHDDILQLLLNHGASVDTVNYLGFTPLHRAAIHGHDGILQLLLNHGASVDDVNNVGDTPLHKAACRGHVKCIKVCFSREIVNVQQLS